MKAIMVEKYSQSSQAFVEGLNEATGCKVYQANSLEVGLRAAQEKHVDLILVNLDEQSGEGWRVAERIRSESRDVLMRCPHMILLSDQPRSIDDVVKCRDLDAVCMLRQSFAAIYEEARVAFRMRLTRKMKSTIRIEFRSGHYLLFFCSGIAMPKQILVGFQVAKLAALLAGGLEAYTVEAIADALGVCRQTVKKYMWELRNAFLAAQAELRILEPDKDIFWVARGRGGSCCGIKANIIWD